MLQLYSPDWLPAVVGVLFAAMLALQGATLLMVWRLYSRKDRGRGFPIDTD